MNRRRFLGLSAAAASAALMAAHARDAYAADLLPDLALAPADKDLPADWQATLYARGVPTRYSATDLRYIGMPVGGGCCGQVYLGGDGRLWYWDIDNGPAAPGADFGGETYASPRVPFFPFGNGFVVKTAGAGGTDVRAVDGTGFADVTFTGQYPIGLVDYRDDHCPVGVHLDAFAPFIPGNTDDSTLPVTVLAYRITNTSPHPVHVELTGWQENPVCLRSRSAQPVSLSSLPIGEGDWHGVEFTAAQEPIPPGQPDILFEGWESGSYDGWTATGTAFAEGPVTVAQLPAYMLRFGDLHVQGKYFVTSHNFIAAKGDATKADSYTGTLTSPEFTIQRRYVCALVGGGNNPGETCLNVLVDGAVVGSVTGNDAEPLNAEYVDLARYRGKTAKIEIVDTATAGWGHLNVDTITFTDSPASTPPLDQLTDGGTAALACFEPDARSRPSIRDWSTPEQIANSGAGPGSIDGGLGTIAGAVTVPMELAPGQSRTVRFAFTWYFPNPDRNALSFLTGIKTLQLHYASRFGSASMVATYLAGKLPALEAATRTWVDTWYTDSTLPYWFLERTLSSASTFNTATCLKFTNGRFYAWEGVDCCPGTCEHVWNYAESIARLFPDLERDTRERVDLGIGFHPATGEIGNRAEADMVWATDGQCGTILRIYREHQMAPDGTFLRRNWPHIKLAIMWVMSQDSHRNGTLTGPQPNTLDATWYGEVAWMTGMYDAALYAGAAMAAEVGDTAFAATCTSLAQKGSASIATDLWTGEYFIQLVDPNHPANPNSNIGCDIDQMFGQSLALQLGLPRVFALDKATTALRNIYRYNFVPDPAAYRKANTEIPGGRWFAMAGEPAMIMATFPHGGAVEANGTPPQNQAAYFNETWTGQEHQLAAQMIYDGVTDEGMTIIRAVHDRYSAAKRNPYNEVECSDHYSRAMAGYGVFLAACGFTCHGPQGRLGFAPRFGQDDFAAAFTAATGWGRYQQQRTGSQQVSTVEVRYGQVPVTTLALDLPSAGTPRVLVTLDGHPVAATISASGTSAEITLTTPVTVGTGQRLTATVDVR